MRIMTEFVPYGIAIKKNFPLYRIPAGNSTRSNEGIFFLFSGVILIISTTNVS